MATNDYEQIARAIHYLEANARHRPSLPEVAHEVGLSEFHFQRLFTRWAGITPKRFLQFMTLEHAKRLLRESRSVLDTAYETGLSGPGRLHDLFVTVESVTPGEFKSGGAGIPITYGKHETPFGACLLAVTPRGLCAVSFLQESGIEGAIADLQRQWPAATITENHHATAGLATRIFAPTKDATAAPISVLVRGTNFQINVWRALLHIPLGAVASYEQLATYLGVPTASRAVGNAVGRNPLPFLIPCHRIIRKTGEFGHYSAGIERKRAMLVWEAAMTTGG